MYLNQRSGGLAIGIGTTQSASSRASVLTTAIEKRRPLSLHPQALRRSWRAFVSPHRSLHAADQLCVLDGPLRRSQRGAPRVQGGRSSKVKGAAPCPDQVGTIDESHCRARGEQQP